MTTHLAVLRHNYIDRILAGEKTIECRLSKMRCAPFGKIRTGETVYLKQSAGPIRAVMTAGRVLTFTDLTPQRVNEIREQYNDQIGGDDAAWARLRERKYGTLIWVDHVRPTSEGPILSPLYGAAWVCNPEERAIASSR